jgi:nucleoside-diphosphate-sugar epimerase
MILVTGGAGVIGSRLVYGLVRAGHRVRVLTLPGDPYVSRLAGLDCEVVFGSVTEAASLRGACQGVETVFHLAAVLLNDHAGVFQRVNADGTRNLVEASIAAGVKHFILCSSISVTYPWTTPYNASKREAERIVREQTAMHWTIVRPTLAYNENGGEEYRTFVEFLKRWPVAIVVGGGRARKNPVHVDDLMRGFLAIPGNSKTYGKVYPFCGGGPITLREMGRLALGHEDIAKPFVSLPVWLCRLAATAMGVVMRRAPFTAHAIAGLTQDALPDWSEARADLGYRPVSFREGLARVPKASAGSRLPGAAPTKTPRAVPTGGR